MLYVSETGETLCARKPRGEGEKALLMMNGRGHGCTLFREGKHAKGKQAPKRKKKK